MVKKSGFLWYVVGAVLMLLSVVIAASSLSNLYLPNTADVLGALFFPVLLSGAGIGLVALGRIVPQLGTKEAVQKARLVADGYNTQVFSYELAHEALEARVLAWENAPWSKELLNRKAVILETLETINRGIEDLGKMSLWFNTSLSGPLYDAARDAVSRVDASKLKFISGFIGYCSSVTEFELAGDYFRTACINANKEVTDALELYASMRAKLSSYSGDPNDIVRLKAEMEQITGLF